jgi:hypothetical protein
MAGRKIVANVDGASMQKLVEGGELTVRLPNGDELILRNAEGYQLSRERIADELERITRLGSPSRFGSDFDFFLSRFR